MQQIIDQQLIDNRWRDIIAGRMVELIARGTRIFTPHESATELFLLISGEVSLFITEDDRRQLRLMTVAPQELFGHIALVGGLYDCYAEATTDVRLIRIPVAELNVALREQSHITVALLEDFSLYRMEVSRQLDELAFKSVPARLASALLDLAQRAGDHLPRPSHRQLAEMINAYRETVTKVFNQFVAAQLLAVDSSKIILLNRRRLEELAQGW